MTLLNNILLAGLATGMIAICAYASALVMGHIIMKDIEELDEQEYIITKDGEKIPYNEEDQE